MRSGSSSDSATHHRSARCGPGSPWRGDGRRGKRRWCGSPRSCPDSARIGCPVAVSQTLIRRSTPAEARRRPVGAERHAEDHADVPPEAEKLAPGRDVPELELPLKATDHLTARGGEAMAVRAEHHRMGWPAVSEGVDLPAGRDVPDPDGSVPARGGEASAVGAERDPGDSAPRLRPPRNS